MNKFRLKPLEKTVRIYFVQKVNSTKNSKISFYILNNIPIYKHFWNTTTNFTWLIFLFYLREIFTQQKSIVGFFFVLSKKIADFFFVRNLHLVQTSSNFTVHALFLRYGAHKKNCLFRTESFTVFLYSTFTFAILLRRAATGKR